MDSLKCPSCGSAMSKVKEPDITIDKCSKCGGTFLDKNELNVLATGMAGNIETCSVDKETHKDQFPSRKCPKCTDQSMNKEALLCSTDIVLDYCPQCNGFFFDKGEIKEMNMELRKFAGTASAEEYRKQHDNHLVRIDKLKGVTTVSNIGGVSSSGRNIASLAVSVYYNKPLKLGLRVYSEKWTYKLAKVFGLSKKQDIQVEDSKLDSAFIIQGHKPEGVKKLLASPNVRKELLDCIGHKPKIFTEPGSLEVLDDRVVYVEGPYAIDGLFGSKLKYDFDKVLDIVGNRMLRLVKAIEGE